MFSFTIRIKYVPGKKFRCHGIHTNLRLSTSRFHPVSQRKVLTQQSQLMFKQKQEGNNLLQEDGGSDMAHPRHETEDTSRNLLFYLEGQQLNIELTVYQSILKQQTESEHDNIPTAGLWSHVYQIAYRRDVTTKLSLFHLKKLHFLKITPFFSCVCF